MGTPVDWILFGLWLIVAGFAVLSIYRRFTRVYQVKWFDQSKTGPNKDMEWGQIKWVIENDPIRWSSVTGIRTPLKYIIFDLTVAIGLLSLISGSFCLILSNALGNSYALELFRTENVAFWTILAFIIGAVSIYYQINLKAKAENRQKWINQIREDISVLLSHAPTKTASTEEREQAQKETRLHSERLKLSLNPSERVHRGMLAAIRFLYKFNQIRDIDCDKCGSCDKCILFELGISTQNGPNDETRDKVVRLGNILFKREWEQTKIVG